MSFDPSVVAIWFGPFLTETSSQLSFDPWSQWVGSGGNLDAFPYGYIMWLYLIAFTFLGGLFGADAGQSYLLAIFVADLALLLMLFRVLPSRPDFVLKLYWLSPIIIFMSYGLGLNDIVPAALLMASVMLLRSKKFILSALVLICAVSAKLSMVVALPFFLFYIYNNKSRRKYLADFCFSAIFCVSFLGLPFLLSDAALSMLFGNPEMVKIFNLALPVNSQSAVYLVPLIYLSLVYMGWRVRPLNFDLFATLIGVSFFVIVLFTPTSPGWFIWALPFLVIYQARGDKVAVLLVASFSLAYLVNAISLRTLDYSSFVLNFVPGFTGSYNLSIHSHIFSSIYTVTLFFGGLIIIRMWREEITRNDYFRFSRKPMVIGIAGDSGSGKDTLASALERLVGSHSAVMLSGDDYHRWDRRGRMWQVMTHINPMANDLQSFSDDLFKLRDGRNINQRHYDHSTGKMTKPRVVKSNQFIFASGLHTFSLPLVRNACDLKIFLDINEDLRRFFKIKRDVYERGHTKERVLESLKSRQADSTRFIRPQAHYAEIVMGLEPLNSDSLGEYEVVSAPRLKLLVTIRNSYNEVALQRVLVGICGLHVDLVSNDNGFESTLTIEGDSKAEDMAQAAVLLCPDTLEYMDEAPEWEDGMLGIMQIIVFSQISQLITKSLYK
jgi:uridine kinase